MCGPAARAARSEALHVLADHYRIAAYLTGRGLRCACWGPDAPGVNRADDDRHLDAVTDLSRLSDRQLLERLVRSSTRMENAMSAASDYMAAALSSLDVQMGDLKTRLTDEAAALKAAVDAAANGQLDTAALSAAADRVQATAVAVAGLAQPSVVADPEAPETAEPLPAPADPAPSAPAEFDPNAQ